MLSYSYRLPRVYRAMSIWTISGGVMETVILAGISIFLSCVLAIGLLIQYAAWRERKDEKERRKAKNWSVVFELTDLRKETA